MLLHELAQSGHNGWHLQQLLYVTTTLLECIHHSLLTMNGSTIHNQRKRRIVQCPRLLTQCTENVIDEHLRVESLYSRI